MTKILKTPSLESVEEHFKDAKVVECLVSKEHYNIKGGEIEYVIYGYWIDLDSEILKVWNDSQGFATIIK